MGNAVLSIPATGWPPLRRGDRNDRGYVHLMRPTFAWVGDTGEDFQLTLNLPARETWIVRWLKWGWTFQTGGCPTASFSSLNVSRVIRGWEEMTWTGAQPTPEWVETGDEHLLGLLPTLAGLDTAVKKVRGDPLHGNQTEDLREHVFDPESVLRWTWETLTEIATFSVHTLVLEIEAVRIPMAKERAWERDDMEAALTDIGELSRRVE